MLIGTLTLEIEEDKTTAALRCARTSSHDIGETRLIVGQDIVGTSVRKVL